MVRLNRFSLLASLLLAAIALGSLPAAAADTVADFYKGKTVRIIDGFPPGGGYGVYANLIVRHLSRHLPGNPTVIYQSMPGAGSLTLTNHLYNLAEKDGTVIGAVSTAVAFAPLLGNKEALFDAQKFNWLPSPNTETGLLIVWHAVGINTIEDATKREVFVGTSAASATSSYFGRILNDVFKTKLKLIVGYPDMKDSLLAMERGEIHGFASAFWSSLKAIRPEWVKEGKVKYLVQYGLKPNAELPDVPVARDLAKNADDRLLLDIAMAPLVLGRPYMLPPGVPAERVAAMRKAFMDVFADPDYQAEAAKQQVDIDQKPKTGDEVQEIVASAYRAPKPVIDRLIGLYEAGTQK